MSSRPAYRVDSRTVRTTQRNRTLKNKPKKMAQWVTPVGEWEEQCSFLTSQGTR